MVVLNLLIIGTVLELNPTRVRITYVLIVFTTGCIGNIIRDMSVKK